MLNGGKKRILKKLIRINLATRAIEKVNLDIPPVGAEHPAALQYEHFQYSNKVLLKTSGLYPKKDVLKLQEIPGSFSMEITRSVYTPDCQRAISNDKVNYPGQILYYKMATPQIVQGFVELGKQFRLKKGPKFQYTLWALKGLRRSNLWTLLCLLISVS